MIGERVVQGCGQMGIPLPETAAARFTAFHDLLCQWNERMDLTRVCGEDEALSRHYLDSLTLLTQPALVKPALRVCDMGTGAGFPGMPLAIARPDWSLTLVDSLQKRIAFCQAAAQALDLPIKAVHARAEDFARQERGTYDLVTSRAVAALPQLLELTLPLLTVGGLFVGYKGPGVREEWADGLFAAQALGAELWEPLPVTVPGQDWQHVLVIARQVRPCPGRYPRKPGEPARNPLRRPQK